LTANFIIVNIVATATLDKPVDLELLRQQLPKHVIWDQDIYGGRVAYYKTEEMEGKVSIFWSGKPQKQQYSSLAAANLSAQA
jgi:TATA-box binding protein (TBP) (component of TFIID and TFIIIB)